MATTLNIVRRNITLNFPCVSYAAFTTYLDKLPEYSSDEEAQAAGVKLYIASANHVSDSKGTVKFLKS